MFIEVIHEATHKQSRLTVPLKGQELTFMFPPLEKSIILSLCATCRKYAVCRAKDVFHPFSFLIEVAVLPLDDTYGIYPEVAQPKFPSSGDGVLECGWKMVKGNAIFVFVDVGSESAEMNAVAPGMR